MSLAKGLLWLLVDGLSHTLWQQLAPMLPLRVDCALPLEPLAPNCQTPPSLFSIWSGLDASAHGLTGYEIPDAGAADPLAVADAFSRWPRATQMVWDRWAAAGGRVRTSAVPFVQPQRLAGALLSHTEVYARLVSPPAVLAPGEVLSVPALQLHCPLSVSSDDAAIVVHGVPTGGDLRVPFGGTCHVALSPALPVALAGDTNRAVAVHAQRVEGQPRLCFLGFQPVFVHGRDAALRRLALRHRACSVGNPAKLHASGALGRHVDQGGDGSAELLLLDLLEVMHRSFLDDILWNLRAGGAEVAVAYYPVIDLLSHQLLRHLDPAAAAPQPALASAIRARMARWLFELFDGCQALLPPGWRFIAHSDHGMQPLSHDLAPNRCFASQGWLATQDDGRIDTQRSMMFYHPAENGWLALHPQRMAAAGVTTPALLDALNDALPPGLSGAFRLIEGPVLDLGDGWTSPWYLQPPTAARLLKSPHLPFAAASRKGGDHTCWSDAPWLKGVFLEPTLQPGAPAWQAPLTLIQLAPALMAGLAQPAPARALSEAHAWH
ncbi:hypothetical protein FHT32_006717 [Variovorax sp. SG517]|uniref:hypothetical protein n=1 Tax=Variovorax sp. SG517 TaxID=2587117 RepID=UPI00159DFD4A|nr:hypothetical protein [Variovorax sp. SG517]NVM93024.1 hypothetical protein [Variovorax sp. SG517]